MKEHGQYVVFSSGIAKIPFLKEFLRADFNYYRNAFVDITHCTGVLGWGYRPTTNKSRKIAAIYNRPFIALEDGFIRSFGTGRHCAPLSLVMDKRGIYYNSFVLSDLEDILNSEQDVLSYRIDEVNRAKRIICECNISKYNHAPLFNAPLRGNGKKILVVDQTRSDMSVTLGNANAQTFAKMLEAAREENPDATIYIKSHPEVSSGKKAGYFTQIKEDQQTVLLKAACNPVYLIKQMDHVYVVTSTMGFEALLLGKQVSVFGLPWYGGWGLTNDRQQYARRIRTRTTDELFAAAYFDYARYLNPYTKCVGTIFDVIDWIRRQRIYAEKFPGRLICVGFRKWKAANLRSMLSLNPEKVVFVKNAKEAEKRRPRGNDCLVCWGRTPPPDIDIVCEKYSVKLLHLEDGFIRSVGLGSDLIRPLSIVMDEKGLYFDATKASALESILNDGVFPPEEIERAVWIKNFIIEHGITKYNTEPLKNPDWNNDGKTVILVIGQVEDDASISYGACEIKTNLALLQTVRQNNPHAWIVFKPHPDVLAGNRKGNMPVNDALQWADHVEKELSVVSCLEHTDEVHTITSLSGFEALIRNKKVFAYGRPFYAGWGLLENDVALPRRNRKLTVDELIAATLIRYPVYWDEELKGYTTCEAVLRTILQQRNMLKDNKDLVKISYAQRQWQKLRILLKTALTNLR